MAFPDGAILRDSIGRDRIEKRGAAAHSKAGAMLRRHSRSDDGASHGPRFRAVFAESPAPGKLTQSLECRGFAALSDAVSIATNLSAALSKIVLDLQPVRLE